jgi:LPS sulfotransferase NodH
VTGAAEANQGAIGAHRLAHSELTLIPAGTDAGLEFMRTAFPDPQFVWLRRADKVRQGISWWRADVTGPWGPRPD